MKKILIATGNKGKFREFCEYFEGQALKCISASGYSIIEPDETGQSFAENALIKAKYYNKHTNLPALADDSGLVIGDLNGDPGIYSARWAGINKDFNLAIMKIKGKLEDRNINLERVKASFYCALCLYESEHNIVYAKGEVKGHLVFPARGNNGFGYDPIFRPLGQDLTFAEMSKSEKVKYSHRVKAINQIIEYL